VSILKAIHFAKACHREQGTAFIKPEYYHEAHSSMYYVLHPAKHINYTSNPWKSRRKIYLLQDQYVCFGEFLRTSRKDRWTYREKLSLLDSVPELIG